MQNRCTYCGKVKKLTDDHVFPKCLNVGLTKDRPVFAKSCKGCNGTADESLLKSYMVAFDDRFWEARLLHFSNRKGKVDSKKFFAACRVSEGGAVRIYPNERITKTFKKIFMGMRRYFLKDAWTYLGQSCFTIVAAELVAGSTNDFLVHPWPLNGPKLPIRVSPGPDEVFDNRFRAFSFGVMDLVDPENMAMCLKYEQQKFNKLNLWCGVSK